MPRYPETIHSTWLHYISPSNSDWRCSLFLQVAKLFVLCDGGELYALLSSESSIPERYLPEFSPLCGNIQSVSAA